MKDAIYIQVDSSLKQKLKRASIKERRTLSNFMLLASEERADDILLEVKNATN
jgi:uncharacterized protein (DUF1778 family)